MVPTAFPTLHLNCHNSPVRAVRLRGGWPVELDDGAGMGAWLSPFTASHQLCPSGAGGDVAVSPGGGAPQRLLLSQGAAGSQKA